MSRFRPARVSPPPKPVNLPTAPPQISPDVSRSSAVSIPELAALTPDEVQFIDAVIERAPPSASTFLTVFKAYNDVLLERGLDPQNEVVIYGKLLKIGTLRGPDWGEKWRMVKVQYGYGRSEGVRVPTVKPAVQRPAAQAPAISTRLMTGMRPPPRDEDTFTLHSHEEGTTNTPTDAGTEADADAHQYHTTPRPLRRYPSPAPSSITAGNSLGLDITSNTRLPQAAASRVIHPKLTRNPTTYSAPTETTTTLDVTPPPPKTISYVSVVPTRKPEPPKPVESVGSRIIRPTSAQGIPNPAAARLAIAQARERRGSVINEDDAWNKIKMAQDEKEADAFREEKLLERCWHVWRQGYDWIISTNEQIAEARDHLILRIAVQRWRALTASRRELYLRVTKLSNNRKSRAAFNIWKSKLKEKRKEEWRQGMRNKMKSIREKRELKLKKDAWAKWRQLYRSHLSDQHYAERLVLRFYGKWKRKFVDVDHLEGAAEDFARLREEKGLGRYLGLWRRAVELRNAERAMRERVGLRVMTEVVDVWKGKIHSYHQADAFYDAVILKKFIRSWKAARDRIRTSENRADKHLARQDDILVRAVLRVWKAHERGRLLERVKTVRLLKQAFAMWKKRIQDQKDLEEKAIVHSMRSKSSVGRTSLRIWHQTYMTRRNAQSFALQYHSAQLSYKMVHIWRVKLRVKLGMIKQARRQEKYFVQRRACKLWLAKLEEKRREKKLRFLEQQKLAKLFIAWLQRSRRQRHNKKAEQVIQEFVSRRIMCNALARWTNRVIEIKSREIDFARLHDLAILSAAFKKWKTVCIRHADEVSLMESYQVVKREETTRRMFYKWLASSRAARHRRVLLQQREEEMKYACLAIAWDRWRGRFKDTSLRPIEYNVITQSQRNLAFRAFGIWHSRTKSLPAIRFHASHTKATFWQKWRDAMPRVLQAKEARDMDKKAVLSKFLDKWVERYKTKIALKAVARARYLRLPTAAPRPGNQLPPLPKPIIAPAFPRRSPRPATPESDAPVAGPSRPSPFSASSSSQPKLPNFRTGISSLLASRSSAREPVSSIHAKGRTDDATSRGSRSPTRPRFYTRDREREPSPTRSKSSFTGGRETSPTRVSRPPSSSGNKDSGNRLWMELREVRKKSRPPTERSWEPP
ncbi:hypothetical protein JAAARDRAFT_191170 [Jaapia argillacea MUCL 33604]|uniref:Sfi1 spindle body domain-containing protein n=1 Tax=Jaapia argillacea MUCL 33604 TaxID=933084 RepID=A0A067QEL2_9AGAM|nr:hypothetical protein JAAARDRAFT_191170 [Jaapia argillacea MUCL 33604]